MPWTRNRIIVAGIWLVIVVILTTAFIPAIILRIVVGIAAIVVGSVIIHRVGRKGAP